jgi:chemotaxis protein histidine kinase CheA
MSNDPFTPTNLYLIGLVLLASLVVTLGLSVYYYWRAKELAPYLMRLEDLLKKIAEGQNTLEEVKAELRAKIDEVARAEKLVADGKAAEEWLKNEAPKIEALKTAVETQQQRLKDATENAQKRQDELNNLSQQVADKNVELKNVTEKKDALDIETARLETKASALTATITEKERKVGELEQMIARLSERKAELDASVKDLEHRVETLEKKFRETSEALTHGRSELEKIRSDAAVAQGEANVAKRIIAEGNKTREMNDERWEDLDRCVVLNACAPKVEMFSESEWLAEFTKSLEAHGFKFNDRSIRAFHTGLKCAEFSPLVVLAGISGTGKSLLPELYASAIGMNFLPVAVQPRWDSPQDLFGFYNYMEGRYKATELSRLLWQFDKYNNGEAEKKFAEAMPMNLILLDEMNLARVEYYFSDLLSKLEIRHGIDATSPDQRRKAEVELESNASAKNAQTRRLFVSENNLFIGTMNEDESTQTLSDKVLDRANVIRFGRPKMLAVKPDKIGFLKEWAGQQPIAFSVWDAWCGGDLKRSDERTLKQLLDELNESMDAVGRPFGHRVNHAIERYVACYPGTFNQALSDQIEMKILPKLNGLDGQTDGFNAVMDKLSGVIDGLGDGDLSEAFKKSQATATDSFFKWRGVMR